MYIYLYTSIKKFIHKRERYIYIYTYLISIRPITMYIYNLSNIRNLYIIDLKFIQNPLYYLTSIQTPCINDQKSIN